MARKITNPKHRQRINDLADFLTEREEKLPYVLDFTEIAELVFEYMDDKKLLKEA